MASRYPVCSPDGKWVYYQNDGAGQIWRVPADGSGHAEVIPGSVVPNTIIAGLCPALSPNGKFLAFVIVNALNPDVMKPEDKIALGNLDSAASPLLLKVETGIDGPGFQFPPPTKPVCRII